MHISSVLLVALGLAATPGLGLVRNHHHRYSLRAEPDSCGPKKVANVGPTKIAKVSTTKVGKVAKVTTTKAATTVATPKAAAAATDESGVWVPDVSAAWQIVLRRPVKLDAAVDPDVAIWDLDLFDNSVETFKTLQDAGKKVICYFSAGSYENWRDDKGQFQESDMGSTLDGWPDERWLKLDSENVRNIMKQRIELAASKGCNAIDPDNVDGYQNENGLGLTKQHTIDFMRFMRDEARKHKMSIGLKNSGDIIPDVLDFMDFSVNEQCAEFNECATFAPFIKAGKPVFQIEYPLGSAESGTIDAARAKEICSRSGGSAGSEGFSTMIKYLSLDGFVQYCDGTTFTTEVAA